MERMQIIVNRWGLELATYNSTFKWISGACNKAADCLSCLVKLPQTNLQQSICYLKHTLMDLHLTPGVEQLTTLFQ